MRYLLLFFIILNSYADCTLNNNVSAGFNKDTVKVYFTSNSTCTNANITQSEMLSIISDAVNNYWNRIPSSRLRLVNGGVLTTTDTAYINGDLCNPDLETCEGTVVPKNSDIVIACNNNTTSNNNFKPVGGNPSKKIAVALPNNISGKSIVGSVIVINDTVDAPFRSLDYAQRVATIAHEIGHAFGLGHNNNSSSLMYWQVQSIRHSLSSEDVACVSYLYPVHLDGCGLLTIGAAKYLNDNDQNKNDPSNGSFMFSLLFGLFLVISFNLRFKRST